MTETLTDIQGAVDGAFDELECHSTAESSCGGKVSSYVDRHGCHVGFLCAEHTKRSIEVVTPQIKRILARRGAVTCPDCGEHFDNEQSYRKLYVL